MSVHHPDEKTVFNVASAIDSPELRQTYLDQICGDNPSLRSRVLHLLQMHNEEPEFLEASPVGVATIDAPQIAETLGDQIGPYRLRERIAEGGMGVVYVAEQSQPVARKVALKVIKPGMDTSQVIARFEAESQALAMMDHPNVAKVLDAGSTDSGRPYFVMDLVRGLPITEYCDGQKLSPRQRLELIVTVCDAIQHAHQKGIIHRDIKPNNVLVTRNGDRAVPKVIDFGIAKAINQRLTERTIYSQFNQLIGTPLYMSPEQAEMSELDVDTRSDIYSLGVLLYELLTGSTPFEKEQFNSVGYDELRRIVREEEPPRPSDRISTLAAERLSTISDQRGSEPHKLSHAMRGELDWIVMKALEKDPNRRYESASAFAADIQRFLTGEAVEACPPSAGYRFRKFARRHKAALTTAAIVTTALLLGIVGTTWQAWRATRERDEKQTALNQSDANLALAREAIDEMYTNFASRWISDDASLSALQQEFLRKGLDIYAQLAVARSDASKDRYDAGVAYFRIADIRYYLNEHAEAAAALEKAIEIQEELMEEDPTDLNEQNHRLDLVSRYGLLGFSYEDLGELDKQAAAIARASELLQILERKWPDSGEVRQMLFAFQISQIRLAQARGEFDTAEKLVLKSQDTIEAFLRNGGQGFEDQGFGGQGSLICCKQMLAESLRGQQRLDEAEQVAKEALKLGEDLLRDGYHDSREVHVFVMELHSELGEIALDADRLPDAEDQFRKTLELRRRLLKSGRSPATFFAAKFLGDETGAVFERELFFQYCKAQLRWALVLQKTKRWDEAEKVLGEVWYVSDHIASANGKVLRYRVLVADCMTAVARLLQKRESEETAEAYQAAAAAWREIGRDFPNGVHSAEKELAALRDEQPELFADEIPRELQTVHATFRNDSIFGSRALAHVFFDAGYWEETIGRFTRLAEQVGDGTAYDQFCVAMAHHQLGNTDEAGDWYQRTVAAMQEGPPAEEELEDLRARAAELLEIDANGGRKPAETQPSSEVRLRSSTQ